MWRKIGRVLLVLVIWGAIAAYIVCSAMLTRRHKSEQSVERVEIELVDSTSSGQLITSQRVKEMLLENGIGRCYRSFFYDVKFHFNLCRKENLF